jgi:hypothetical protein
MREVWLYRVLVALSSVTFLLVVAYSVLAQENRSIQSDVNRRQQFINQSIELRRINDVLVRTIATAAISKNDDKLRQLLTQNGITINAPADEGKMPAQETVVPAGKQ